MSDFVWQVVLSFFVGGLYIGALLWISEHFGSRLGGIISGIPSTVLVSLIFIAIISGDGAAQQAALVIPAMIAVALIFVYVFTRLFQRRIAAALLIAVLIWLMCAWLIVALHIHGILLSAAIGVIGIGLFHQLFRDYPENIKVAIKPTRVTNLLRMFIAGSVIALAVVMAKLSGPTWGGVFAGFPATFASMLYMLRYAHGAPFACSVARQLPLSVTSTWLFAVLFYLLVVDLGALLSTCVAVSGSILYTLILRKMVIGKAVET